MLIHKLKTLINYCAFSLLLSWPAGIISPAFGQEGDASYCETRAKFIEASSTRGNPNPENPSPEASNFLQMCCEEFGKSAKLLSCVTSGSSNSVSSSNSSPSSSLTKQNDKSLGELLDSATKVRVDNAIASLEAQNFCISPQEQAELYKKAQSELSSLKGTVFGTVLKTVFPNADRNQMAQMMRLIGTNAEQILEVAQPTLKSANPNLYKTTLVQLRDALSTATTQLIRKILERPLTLTVPPKQYPANQPDRNRLWHVTPKYDHANKNANSKAIERELVNGIFNSSTGYIKNTNSVNLKTSHSGLMAS